jgi:phage-related minor tail protein
MVEVVGLRFVVEGDRKATAAIETFERQKQKLSSSILQGVGIINRLEGELKRLLDAYQRGTITERTYREGVTQTVRAYKFLNEGVRGTAMSMQKASADVHAMRRALEQQKAAAEQLAITQQRMESAYALAMQRHQEETAVAQAANQARERARQQYDQLKASIDPAVAAQQRYAEAERRINEALKQGVITHEQARRSLDQYAQALARSGDQAVMAATFTGRLRQQFLATANSIAILDGPLGGVASRFSAFGVLIGRTGLIVGGLLVSMAALGTVVGRGIRNVAEWEATYARINAILETTGNRVGMTAREIQSLTSAIALNTLESEQSLQAAAQRLLTFRDIAGDTFAQVLRSATDMAALGFGTVESESLKLAKALEDPAQALTSLSRAGIVFTRQQRQVIISLVESGQRAEAMERILDNVRRRTQGAAEAAAAGTLAGAFDTIGQAVGRATRDFAQWVLTITGAEEAIQGVASRLASYAGNVALGLEDRVLRQQALVHDLQREARLAETLMAGLRAEIARLADPDLPAEERARLTQALPAFQEELARLGQFTADNIEKARQQLRELFAEMAERRTTQFVTQMETDISGVENLRMELSLREAAVTLTDEQARIQRMLAQEGLLNVDIAQRTADVLEHQARIRQRLIDQGVDAALADAEAKARIDNYYRALVSVEDITQRIARAERQRADMRSVESVVASLEQENALLGYQLGFLRQGISLAEAQRRATIALHQARIAQLVTEGAITKELGKQLSLRLAQLAAEGEEIRVAIEPFQAGGGGGGRAQEVITLAEIQQKLLEEQRIRTELLGLMGEELRIREVYYDVVRQLGDQAVNYTEEQIMATARLVAAQMDLNDTIERQRQLQEQVASTLANLFMAATQGAESFKQALSGVLRQLAQMLANRAFMQIMGRFGLGFMAPLPTTASANGNAFMGGNVIPFAKGGVVDSPTLFPMARGRTGLMGEAGPEAVMPLRRGRDGKLGVGGEPQQVAVDVRVHVDENGNWQANVAKIADARVGRAAPRIISQSVGATYAASAERKMR